MELSISNKRKKAEEQLRLEKIKRSQLQEKANVALAQVISEAKAIGIAVSGKIEPEVKINTRAKSRFGCCKREKRGTRIYFRIEVAEDLLQGEEKYLKQTLAHEALHTCKGCYNHSEAWKTNVAKMNEAYGYKIKRTSSQKELGLNKDDENATNTREVKYVIVCEKCGIRTERQRMSKLVKYPNLFRCKCGGRLKRIQ